MCTLDHKLIMRKHRKTPLQAPSLQQLEAAKCSGDLHVHGDYVVGGLGGVSVGRALNVIWMPSETKPFSIQHHTIVYCVMLFKHNTQYKNDIGNLSWDV